MTHATLHSCDFLAPAAGEPAFWCSCKHIALSCKWPNIKEKYFEAQGLKLAEAMCIIQVNYLMPTGRVLAAMYLPQSLPANYNSDCDSKGKSSRSCCTPAAGNVELLFRLYRTNSHIVHLSNSLEYDSKLLRYFYHIITKREMNLLF